VRAFADYCVGLLSAEGRKSVEPLAAVTAPERTAAQHQSLLHFVAQAPWSDQAMLRRVRECVLPSITRDEPIQAWIIDDTGFPKKGSHSVGVARQYCGQLGKQDNCQVAAVQLIGSTTTVTGLKVCCEIDGNLYPKGLKVTDQEIQAIDVSRNEFHGEWNYSIAPNQQP
jgi:SRSO17 transposase